MFRTMAFRPGDGLKFEVTGKSSGIPTARLTIIPAGALLLPIAQHRGTIAQEVYPAACIAAPVGP